MKEIILIKNGELTLKGLNRCNFEDILIRNIRKSIRDLGECNIKKAQSTIFIEPRDDSFDFEEALERIKRVFGIAAFSRACVCEKDMADIIAKSPDYLREDLKKVKTFKVEAKRSDKRFPLTSPEICREIGGVLLSHFPHLSVDVHNPELVVNVEIRDFNAYVRGEQIQGAGGLPVGTAGTASILISGGIDSPVAAWTMAKRGLRLNAIHFASPPYTSQRAEEKVCRLLEIVSEYAGRMTMYTVPFTEIQEEIRDKVPEELFTIIMRRLMMEISQRIAEDKGCQALITGESLGQVASQTIGAIACTDIVCSIPVFRPLIGMDKDEIVTISRQIGTFETSIEPYEDCCTVFTPKHPRTRPVLSYVEEAQNQLDCQQLIERAIANVKITKIGYGDR